MVRESSPRAFEPEVPGLLATIRFDNGAILELSRLEGETEWYADAEYAPNGAVYYAHGFGSRSVAKRVAGNELAALLDRAASEGCRS